MKASLEAITDLANRTLTISASGESSWGKVSRNSIHRPNLTHPDHGESQSLDERTQRAEVGSEQMRQHVDSLVYEIDSSTSRSGLRVHRVVRVHKVGHVGDVYHMQSAEHTGSWALLTDTSLDIAIRQLSRVQSVVNVLTTCKHASADIVTADTPTHRLGRYYRRSSLANLLYPAIPGYCPIWAARPTCLPPPADN